MIAHNLLNEMKLLHLIEQVADALSELGWVGIGWDMVCDLVSACVH